MKSVLALLLGLTGATANDCGNNANCFTSGTALREKVNECMPGSTWSTSCDAANWDVSRVTSMANLFLAKTSFNENITNWDVSSVTNMEYMFYYATSFNQDIGGWDVGKVTNMKLMFGGAQAFDANIAGWNVGNVTTMSGIFSSDTAFNQTLCEAWYNSPATDKPTSDIVSITDQNLDSCGVCGGDDSSCTGCTDTNAFN